MRGSFLSGRPTFGVDVQRLFDSLVRAQVRRLQRARPTFLCPCWQHWTPIAICVDNALSPNLLARVGVSVSLLVPSLVGPIRAKVLFGRPQLSCGGGRELVATYGAVPDGFWKPVLL